MASTEPDRVRPGPPTGPLRPWPVLRSLAIALVLLVHGTLALPWPDLRPRDLRYGVAQDELKRWSGILGDLGVEITPDALAERVLDVGRASIRAQRTIHGPFRPLLRLTGTGQSWGLFAYPDPYAGRLVVRTRGEDGEWTERYRAPGQGDPALVELLQYRRVRGIYDDNGDRPNAGTFYDRMARWLAARIMAAEADVAAVEVRFDLVTIRVPGDPRPEKAEEPRHVRTLTRAQVRERLALLGVEVPEGADTGESVIEPPRGLP